MGNSPLPCNALYAAQPEGFDRITGPAKKVWAPPMSTAPRYLRVDSKRPIWALFEAFNHVHGILARCYATQQTKQSELILPNHTSLPKDQFFTTELYLKAFRCQFFC